MLPRLLGSVVAPGLWPAELATLVLMACTGVPATPTSLLPTPTVSTSLLCEPGAEPEVELFNQRTFQMELGFRSTTPGEITPVQEESLVVAGDLNIINAYLLVQYQVKDFEAFVSNVDDPEGCPNGRTLRNAGRAALSEAVGRRGMDDVVGVNRGEMGVEMHEKLQEILDRYETGIEVVVIWLLTLEPPEELLDAFANVFRAGQDKVVSIAQAEAYQQGAVLGAGAEAERIIPAAESASVVRIIQATEQADRFVSILRAYEAETEEVFRGLYLDSLEGILPGTA